MCQPGRPWPSAVSQECLAGLGGLPEREVAGGVLVVLVDVDARAVLDAFEVLLGELAVLGKARDAEVPGAVLGAVGDVLRGERSMRRDHLRMYSVARAMASGCSMPSASRSSKKAFSNLAVYSPMGSRRPRRCG